MLEALVALDVETRSLVENHQEYALQPWRVLTNEAEVTMLGVLTSTGESSTQFIQKDICKLPQHKTYVMHNAIFDTAWLLAYGYYFDGKTILDTIILAKFHSPMLESYSLVNLTKHFLPNWPHLKRFIALKQSEKENLFQTVNTKEYNLLDCEATLLLAELFIEELSPQQLKLALIECNCIVYCAKMWLNAHPIDLVAINKVETEQKEIKQCISNELLITDAVLKSPKQLSSLIYDVWQVPKLDYSNSVGREVLEQLVEQDNRINLILLWRHADTIINKYVKKLSSLTEYFNSPIAHPTPRIHSTYTGRMTYSSTMPRTERKIYKNGKVIIQQKEITISDSAQQRSSKAGLRNIFTAPEGHMLIEFDAKAQEGRLMAELSKDYHLCGVFNKEIDWHRFTAEQMDVPRASGKLANLSCMYRISGETLYKRSGHKNNLTETYCKNLVKQFRDIYPGIVEYWDKSINKVKRFGYSETLGGRRFYPDVHTWEGAQTAINFPVQGSGADEKYLALSYIQHYIPELNFYLDYHDGIWFTCKEDVAEDCLKRGQIILNEMDYKRWWGHTMLVPHLWDAKIGKSMGEMNNV